MAYVKHTWECGDKITIDRLNHMEQGIEDASSGGSGVAVVHISGNDTDGYTADMTCDEIEAVLLNGGMVFAEWGRAVYPLISAECYGNTSSQTAQSTPTLKAVASPRLAFAAIYVTSVGVSSDGFAFYDEECRIEHLIDAYPSN